MRNNMFRKIIIPSCILLSALSLSACAGSSFPGNMDVTAIEGSVSPEFEAAFSDVLKLISVYDYNGAKEKLETLKSRLKTENNPDSSFMRAETDYALGRVNDLLGNTGDAFDCYNSAYAFYKDILGSSAPRTADARLHLAFLSSDRDAVRYADETQDSDADQLFKDIAYCLSAEIYTNLDNNREAESFLKKTDSFASGDKAGEASRKDEEISRRLYGESAETTSLLGRVTLTDRYTNACQSKGRYFMDSNLIDEAIGVYEDELSGLGSGLKSEIARAQIYDDLGFLKLYYKGDAEGNSYMEDALALYEKLYPTGAKLAYCYVSLAEKQYTLGNYTGFYDHLMKARDVMENVPGRYHRATALIDLRLAAYYSLQSEHAKAVECAEEALDIYRALLLDDSMSIGSAYNILANSYVSIGATDKVKETYEKSIQTYRELGYDVELASTLRNRALITNNTFCDHDEALKYAREAISIVEGMDHNNNSKTIAAVYMVMADILRPSDPEYKKIEEYSKKAYACLQNAVGNTDEYFANYHYNYGNYLKDNFRYDEALEHLTACEGLFGKIYDATWKYPVDVFFDMGECLYFKGEHEAAVEMLNRAVSFENEVIDRGGKPSWCTYLQSNRDKAREYLRIIEQEPLKSY